MNFEDLKKPKQSSSSQAKSKKENKSFSFHQQEKVKSFSETLKIKRKNPLDSGRLNSLQQTNLIQIKPRSYPVKQRSPLVAEIDSTFLSSSRQTFTSASQL